MREFGAGSIRYPGGSWTYGYPPYAEAVPVFVKAGMDTYAYGLRDLSRFGWASAEDYFRFCRDAGMTAWYELNPGFWYDRKNREVRKTICMDHTKDAFSGDETGLRRRSRTDGRRANKPITNSNNHKHA